jgi:hypothetical protein
MNSIRKLFTHRISSARTDTTVASLACYGAATLVMVVGITRIGSLNATETEILLATLGVVTLSMLTIAFGQLLEIQQRLRAAAPEKPGSPE